MAGRTLAPFGLLTCRAIGINSEEKDEMSDVDLAPAASSRPDTPANAYDHTAARAPRGIRYRLTEPYVPDQAAVINALTAVVTSNYYTQGPRVKEFERTFASHVGRTYAIACNSGTSALHLALDALRIAAGDAVLLPAYTCVATVLPIKYARARAVYAERFGGNTTPSWNMSGEDVNVHAHEDLKAVVPVALYGEPLSDDLFAACAERGIPTIEDACEASGAAGIGRSGTISCFSLRGDKMFTSGGSGGMALTDDPELARRMLIARDMHLPIEPQKRYDATGYGFSYEMAELQAAMGLVTLGWLGESVARRRSVHAWYRTALATRGVFEMIEHTDRSSVWRVAIRPADPKLRNRAWRDGFLTRARSQGVEVLPGFTPLSWLANPDVKHEVNGVCCIPCHPKLTRADVEEIVSTLEAAIKEPSVPRLLSTTWAS
jgi:perosamine synthetase